MERDVAHALVRGVGRPGACSPAAATATVGIAAPVRHPWSALRAQSTRASGVGFGGAGIPAGEEAVRSARRWPRRGWSGAAARGRPSARTAGRPAAGRGERQKQRRNTERALVKFPRARLFVGGRSAGASPGDTSSHQRIHHREGRNASDNPRIQLKYHMAAPSIGVIAAGYVWRPSPAL